MWLKNGWDREGPSYSWPFCYNARKLKQALASIPTIQKWYAYRDAIFSADGVLEFEGSLHWFEEKCNSHWRCCFCESNFDIFPEVTRLEQSLSRRSFKTYCVISVNFAQRTCSTSQCSGNTLPALSWWSRSLLNHEKRRDILSNWPAYPYETLVQ